MVKYVTYLAVIAYLVSNTESKMIELPSFRGAGPSADLPLTHRLLRSQKSKRFEQHSLTMMPNSKVVNGTTIYEMSLNFVDTSTTNYELENSVYLQEKDSDPVQIYAKCNIISGLNWEDPFSFTPVNWSVSQKSYKDPKNYYTSGVICNAMLPIECDKEYTYKVKGDSNKHPILKQACRDAESVTFLVTADLGQTDDSKQTMKHMAQAIKEDKEVSALLFPGDLSYADGAFDRWDSWGRIASKIYAKSIPAIYSPGNHELVNEVLARYFAQFAAHKRLFYSVDVGPVHVISLSSYSDSTKGSAQYNWLVNNLNSINRTVTPWVIIQFHTPTYNSNENHLDEGEGVRKVLEPLFHQHSVDLVFAGHVHSYERSKPSFNLKPEECGITYINIGDGGNREGVNKMWLDEFNAPYRAKGESSFGFGKLKILNKTHAEWNWSRNMGKFTENGDNVILNRECRNH